jgi:hypothetical protein
MCPLTGTRLLVGDCQLMIDWAAASSVAKNR